MWVPGPPIHGWLRGSTIGVGTEAVEPAGGGRTSRPPNERPFLSSANRGDINPNGALDARAP